MIKLFIFVSTFLLTAGHIAFDYLMEPDESSAVILVDFLYMVLCLAQAWTVVHYFYESFKRRLEEKEKDVLTGALVRGAMIDRIFDEQYRVKRDVAHFSLIMFDIDFFKNVNDTFGHSAGDEVLKHTISLFSNNLRQIDLMGRWGGEEFVIMLPCTELHGGVQVAEKLRLLLINNPCTWKKHSIPITASFGVVECSMLDTSVEALVERADDEMYRAKEEGRNKVCSNTMSTFMRIGSATDPSSRRR